MHEDADDENVATAASLTARSSSANLSGEHMLSQTDSVDSPNVPHGSSRSLQSQDDIEMANLR